MPYKTETVTTTMDIRSGSSTPVEVEATEGGMVVEVEVEVEGENHLEETGEGGMSEVQGCSGDRTTGSSYQVGDAFCTTGIKLVSYVNL